MKNSFFKNLFLLIGFCGFAQTFPVSISTQLNQPAPIYWSNYADATTTNSPIRLQITLNDLSIANRQIRLKIYLQGNGIAAASNDFVVGAPDLFLEGGVPLLLNNTLLAPYFEFQNLVGLTPNQYAEPLPEGAYQLAVEVYDFATNKKIAKKTSVTTLIFQNEPPLLNLPTNNAAIVEQNIQNIIFSWTPRSINVSNVEYELALVEIWDPNTPAQNAFLYSPPLYTATTRNTSLQYGIEAPQLIPGKTYAWRIKAKALLGAEEVGVFKNNGYSEVFAFRYSKNCLVPQGIAAKELSQDQAKIEWTGTADNYDFEVKYREKNNNSKWYSTITPREYAQIINLKPNTTYEYSVGAACELNHYTHSSLHELTTAAETEASIAVCGVQANPADLSNQNPLQKLVLNDVIAAGDFPIVVTKATGSNGSFSGEGYVTLPFFEKWKKVIDAADNLSSITSQAKEIATDGNVALKEKLTEGATKIDDKTKGKIDLTNTANTISEKSDKVASKANELLDKAAKYETNIGKYTRIKITFTNIGLNTDFKLISGEIIASYDKNWGSIIDGDKLEQDLVGDKGKVIPFTVDYEIESVTKNPDGTITIKGKNKQITNLAKTVNDYVITDSKGKQITVVSNAPTGVIGVNEAIAAEGGVPTSKNTNGMGAAGNVNRITSKDVSVVFEAGNGFYTFDQNPNANTSLSRNTKHNSSYQTISNADGSTYYVHYKAISNQPKDTDIVVARATFANGKTKDDIVFKTQSGTAITATWSGNEASLELQRTLDYAKETIIATVKPSSPTPKEGVETAGDLKYDIAGTLNLWHLAPKTVNVVLVSINKATIPNDAATELNRIYNPAGIIFATTPKSIDLNNTWGTTIETGDSDLLNTYTDGQQKITQALINELGSEYNAKTYYMLFTNEKASNGYAGFMPLKGQFGFVFDGDTRTLAHELGHGVFGLQHPFNKIEDAKKTTLLLDYGSGELLSHNDWEIMHAPGLQLYQFTQGSSAGARIGDDGITFVLEKDENFITPDGKLILLPKDAIIYNYKLQIAIENGTSSNEYPNGVVWGFKVKDKYYVGKANWGSGGDDFYGYFEVLNNKYTQNKYVNKTEQKPITEISVLHKNQNGPNYIMYHNVVKYDFKPNTSNEKFKFVDYDSKTVSITFGESIEFTSSTATDNDILVKDKGVKLNKNSTAFENVSYTNYAVNLGKNANIRYTEDKTLVGTQTAHVFDLATVITSPEEKQKILEQLGGISKDSGILCKIYLIDANTPKEKRDEINKYLSTLKGKEIGLLIDFADPKKPIINTSLGDGIEGKGSSEMNKYLQALINVLPEFDSSYSKFNPLTALLDGLAGVIGKAAIPATYYNPDELDYNPLPSKIYAYASGKIISEANSTDKYRASRQEFALACGAWNGLVGTVEAIPAGVSMLVKLQGSAIDLIINHDGAREKLIKTIKNINKEQIDQLLSTIGDEIEKGYKKYTSNPCMVSYASGQAVFVVASLFIGAGEANVAKTFLQTLEKLDVAGQLIGKVFRIGGKFLKPILNPVSKKIKFVLAEGIQFIRDTNLKISPSSNLYCGFPIFNIKLIRKGENFTSDELRLLQSKVDEAIKAQGGLEKLPLDEFDNRIVEIDIDGEKIPVIVGTENGLSKIDDGASLQGAGKVFKNIDLATFKKTFTATEEQYAKAYQLWGEDKWDDLYQYFKANDLNNWNGINWPPFNGAKSIIKTEKGNQLAGKVFDRFQNSDQLGGGFASPVLNSNEGVADLVFTYDSRALADRIQNGTHYIKFKLKDNVPSNLEFEYGEAIPWFKLQGNADQVKSNIKFADLPENSYEILEILKFDGGSNKWIKIK